MKCEGPAFPERFVCFLGAAFIPLVLPFSLQSQTPMDNESTIYTLEKVSEVTESDPDYQEAEEFLSARQGTITDLSRATPEQLAQIQGLSPEQSRALSEYIAAYGPPLTLYELRVVPGFDSVTVQKILPYIRIGPYGTGPPVNFTNLVHLARQELVVRFQQFLERKEGYGTGAFTGSPQKYLFRYSYFCSDKIRLVLAGEKDAGEQFFGLAQPAGMDFYAGYLAWSGRRFLRSLVIGNLAARFGQGLVLGSGSRMGNVIGFAQPLHTSQGIHGSSSMDEAGYQRGIGITLRRERLTISAFLSRQKRDGSVVWSDTLPDADGSVTSLGGTGYHRTVAEISKKGTVHESVLGGNLSYTGNFFRIGITGVRSLWDYKITPAPDLYNRFRLQGRSAAALGTDLVIRLRSISFFAEAAHSFPGTFAWIAGVQSEGLQDADLAVTVRSYARDYCNPLAGAPGQNSSCSNEYGVLVTGRFRLSGDLVFSAFADLFSFPWLKYRVDGPSVGLETGALLAWTLSPSLLLTTRYSWTQSQVNSSLPGKLHVLEEGRGQSVRVQLSWSATEVVTLKTLFASKCGWSGHVSSGCGYLMGQGVSFGMFKGRVGLSCSYNLFDIPSYGLRIYLYEPDILYSLSVPACQGRGVRATGRLSVTINKYLDLWGWFGSTWYEDRTEIGAGAEKINGRVAAEIKIQARVRL
jgi:hypothetical protein